MGENLKLLYEAMEEEGAKIAGLFGIYTWRSETTLFCTLCHDL